MDVTAELVAPCRPQQLFRWIDDLSDYPQWLDIVSRAVPAEGHPDDVGPAWSVTLRGRLGPFARAKRLRMVRMAHDPPRLVGFERMEHDGRQHPAWVLRAEVHASEPSAAGTIPTDATDPASKLVMHLHYGGRLGGPPVRKLLADAIERSRARLLQRVMASPEEGSSG